jgi:hypothetical protein
MENPNQLGIGSGVGDAISLAIQVLQSQISFLERAKASLNGDAAPSDDEPDKGRRRRAKDGPRKRSAARTVEDKAIFDYFRKPASVKTMAKDLNLTLTYAHKRVKDLKRGLKRVKEGTSVLYLTKPRRNGKEDKKPATAS